MQQNEDRVNDLKEDVESCSYRLKKKFSSNKNIDIQIISIQITILQVWFPDIPPPLHNREDSLELRYHIQ